jgi:hypothetical protein
MHASRIGLAIILVASTAQAQPVPEPVPEPEPEPEAPAPIVQPAPESPEAPPPEARGPRPEARFSWEPYGYLRIQAGVVQNDPNVAFVGRDDGFELQNARVGVRGVIDEAEVDIVMPKIAFQISIDGAIDERERINDPDGKLAVGLRDAFVDVHLGAFFAVRAGRFDIWFDPEHLYGDTERPFVDRSLESRGTRPTEGWQTDGLTPGRSIGVALRRDIVSFGAPELGMEVAVQNGADEFSSDNDNDLPAVSAALRLALPQGYVLAAARFNPRTEGELPLQRDETDLEGAVGALLAFGPVHVGLGATYVRTSFGTTGGPAQNAYGGHGQLVVDVVRGDRTLGVGYRFAILDPSDLILTDRIMEHTAGAVLAIPRWRLRAQLNVTHVMEQAERELSNGRVEAALEVSL